MSNKDRKPKKPTTKPKSPPKPPKGGTQKGMGGRPKLLPVGAVPTSFRITPAERELIKNFLKKIRQNTAL